MQTMHTYLTVMPVVLGLGIWWVFFSRLTWRTRGIGIALITMLLGVLAALVRVDDVTGEVIPILAWRWSPRREDVAAAYFDKQPSTRASKSTQTAGQASGTDSGTTPDGNAASSAAPEKDDAEPLVVQADDWPEYRGALRDGIVKEASINSDWQKQPPKLLWRHPVGLGWSAFVVVDGLAFTQEQRRERETVVCYDARTGDQIWEHSDVARFSEALGGDGPRATPTLYDGRLYSLGATGILNCLDPRTGRKLWSRDVLTEHAIPNIPWGMAGSPLVYDDVVVVNAGGTEGRGLMAFNRLDGKTVWQAGSEPASYCAPQLSTVDGVRQILLFDGTGIAGHDPIKGDQLWRFPWSNQAKVNAAQPFVTSPDHVLISNGYGVGSAMLKVTHKDATWTVEPQWESKKLRLKFNSGVLLDGRVYGLDEGILTCFEVAEKKQKWRGGRYSFGQLLLIDGWLVILAESGELALVKATPDRFEETAKFQALQGKTWNNMAFWKGLLLIRNGDEAACYDLRPAEVAAGDLSTADVPDSGK